jgi:hypothetical protein
LKRTQQGQAVDFDHLQRWRTARKVISDLCRATAQNAQLWTASVLIGIEPTSAQNGGYLKSSVDNAW